MRMRLSSSKLQTATATENGTSTRRQQRLRDMDVVD